MGYVRSFLTICKLQDVEKLRRVLSGEERILVGAQQLVSAGHPDPATMRKRVKDVMQCRQNIAELRKRLQKAGFQ